MSYRRAWVLVDETNRCLVRPAVSTVVRRTRHGGGTALTPTGTELVRRYRALERRAGRAVAKALRPLLAPVPAPDAAVQHGSRKRR